MTAKSIKIRETTFFYFYWIELTQTFIISPCFGMCGAGATNELKVK